MRFSPADTARRNTDQKLQNQSTLKSISRKIPTNCVACNQRNADPHCTINQIRKQISSNPKECSWRSAYQFEAPRLSFLERPTYTLTSNSTKSYHSISLCCKLIATYVFFSSSARLSRRSQDKPSSNLYPRSLIRSSDSLPCSLLARSFGNLSHCSAHQSGHFSARHSDHLGEHPTAPQQLMRSIRLPNSQA
ncbi:hypothetical protein AtNW77_Chr5g0113581 [Arabidopsis thaliana]